MFLFKNHSRRVYIQEASRLRPIVERSCNIQICCLDGETLGSLVLNQSLHRTFDQLLSWLGMALRTAYLTRIVLFF